MRNATVRAGLLTALILALYSVAYSQAQQPPATPKTADERATGSITGKVVNESGQPMPGAALFLRRINTVTSGRTSTADTEGNFVISSLDAGLYAIMANTPAYIAPPTDPDAPVYHRIGDNVRVELVRGGVVTGSVTNAAGEPVIAVRVRAHMVRDAKGQVPRMPSFGLSEQSTDDRGIYRIYGLAPGTYVVNAGGSGAGLGFQLTPYESDAPTYAPSSTRDTAAEVTVRSGEESNVDIRYRGEPGYIISGNVKITGTASATVTLTPAGARMMPIANAFQVPGRGGFAFSGISDGEYDLVAQEMLLVNAASITAMPQLALSETRRVVVKGANVTGIELIPRPLASVSGRIVLEPSKAEECQGKRPPLLAETLVHFRRPEKEVDKEESMTLRMLGNSGSPDTNGAFMVRNLIPGRYLFEPRFYARYWYLDSISRSGVAPATPAAKPASRIDAVANWTTVKSGEQVTTLTITIAAGAASVRGRLAAAEPPAGVSVYLVPAEADKAEDVLRYFVTEIAADGTFALNNLPPGRYLAFAHAGDAQISTLAKLRLPESATARTKLRRTAESQKSELELKPCQNLTGYELGSK